jgi:hypothetical protein
MMKGWWQVLAVRGVFGRGGRSPSVIPHCGSAEVIPGPVIPRGGDTKVVPWLVIPWGGGVEVSLPEVPWGGSAEAVPTPEMA